jgi:hypothetical protein
MHYAALGAGQADVFQTRSSSLRTRVKDVVTRAERSIPGNDGNGETKASAIVPRLVGNKRIDHTC